MIINDSSYELAVNAITIHLWAEILDYLEENELSATICVQKLYCKQRALIRQETSDNTGIISNIPVCW